MDVGSLLASILGTVIAVLRDIWMRLWRLLRPPIVVRARPPTTDNLVKLLVINRARTQDFQADVIDFAGIAGSAQEPYEMKWRGHPGPVKRILAGSDADIDVAKITPPVFNFYRLTEASEPGTTPGSFHLFSATLPEGWSVSAGFPNNITTMEEAVKSPDPVNDTIALKVRITGAEKVSKTCRVTLGFNRPHEVDTFAPHSPVRIEVDNWPRPPSEVWARIRGHPH